MVKETLYWISPGYVFLKDNLEKSTLFKLGGVLFFLPDGDQADWRLWKLNKI